MQSVRFYGEIKRIDSECDNKLLKFDRIEVFRSYINSLPEGLRVEIEVKKESEDKTLEQLAYYFSCIISPLAEHLGYTKVEMDGVICKQLLTENMGTKKEFVQSKSILSRADLAIFIDGAIMLAAVEGVVVCPPNKQWKD